MSDDSGRKPPRAEPPAPDVDAPAAAAGEARGTVSDAGVLAIAGLLAGGVAAELARPIRELRERLAVIVDELDHHVARAKGPTPYSWEQVGVLRERVAEAYLMSRRAARLAGELAQAAGAAPEAMVAIDVNKTLDAALNLARYRVSAGCEVFADFGAVPVVRGAEGRLLLLCARLIIAAAEREPHAITLSSRRAADGVVVTIRHDGDPDAAWHAGQVAALASLAAAASATVEAIDGGWAIGLRTGA